MEYKLTIARGTSFYGSKCDIKIIYDGGEQWLRNGEIITILLPEGENNLVFVTETNFGRLNSFIDFDFSEFEINKSVNMTSDAFVTLEMNNNGMFISGIDESGNLSPNAKSSLSVSKSEAEEKFKNSIFLKNYKRLIRNLIIILVAILVAVLAISLFIGLDIGDFGGGSSSSDVCGYCDGDGVFFDKICPACGGWGD